MSVLWTSEAAAKATGGVATTEWKATGVSIDTRTLMAGDLFVALKDVRDGHDFVATALERGAAAALVSRRPDDVPETAPLLIVDDVLKALEDLGIAARARTDAKVIAITGSVGKTSTKEMLRAALTGEGRIHAAEASYNNHWGVPLTLARMPADTDCAVLEIGMNHPGEIAPLAKLARPHVALITTVAAAHLEAFENLEGIAHEKASIFDGSERDGTAIVNGDLETTPILIEAAKRQGAKLRTFGELDVNSDRLLDLRLSRNTSVARGSVGGEELLFKLQTAGRHFAVNAIAVFAAVDAVGGDLALAATNLGQWQPPAGRGTIETLVLDAVETQLRIELIDDAFNANPTSLAASLEILAASDPVNDIGRIASGRRIAVLGDMLELGPDEAKLHADVAKLETLAAVDVVHCVGPRMRYLYNALPEHQRGHWVERADEIAEIAHTLIDAGDVILVKGSKGSLVSRVVDALRKLGHPLPDQTQGQR